MGKRETNLPLLALLSLVLVFLCVPATLGLYEDQAGKFDWFRSYLGRVESFHPVSGFGSKNHAIISTDKNVLAMIDSNSGDIVWRRVLGESESVDSILLEKETLYTLTDNGQRLKIWKASNGALFVDQMTSCNPESTSSIFQQKVKIIKSDKETFLLIKACNSVELRESSDASLLWKWAPENFSDVVVDVFFQNTQSVNRVFVLTLSSTGILGWVSLSLSSGQFVAVDVSYHSLSNDLGPEDILSLNSAESVIFSRKYHQIITINSGQEDPFAVRDVSVCRDSQTAKLDGLVGERSFVLTCSPSLAYVISLGDSDKTERSDIKYNRLSGTSSMYSSSYDDEHFFGLEIEVYQTKLNVYERESGKLRTSRAVFTTQSSQAKVYKAFLAAGSSVGDSDAVITFARLDGSLFAVKESKILWRREDSLADIKKTHILNIPASRHTVELLTAEFSNESGLFGIFLAFYKRITTQIIEVKEWAQGLFERKSSNKELVRDTFGFNRIIFVTTSYGTAYGISSHDGSEVWKLGFVSEGNPLAIMSSFVTRNTGVDVSIATLILKDTENDVWYAVDIDPIAGTISRYIPLPYKILQANQLPDSDNERRRLIMVVDSSHQIHIYPDVPNSHAVFKQHYSSRYYYILDKETGKIEGYSVRQKGSSGHAYQGQMIWSFVVPSNQKIETTASRHSLETPYSPVRVLGDRTYLWKYLNPNLLVVITSSEAGSKTQQSSLYVYVLDTVTGSVVYSETKYQAKGPVRALLSDNWIAYHFWNQGESRYDMTGVEMFEENNDDSTESHAFSSWESKPITTIRQDYIFPHTIRTLGVTATEHGLTQKNVLVGLSTGQVLGLDRRFLDPRRPKAALTQADRDEMLLPYNSTIPAHPRNMLTYKYKVSRIQSIVSAPTILESTTLVFAHGLDHFFTKSSPSRTFDVLGEGFSQREMLLFLIVLTLVSLTTRFFGSRATVQRIWA